MRTFAVALFSLVLIASASAQPAVGPEITSGPIASLNDSLLIAAASQHAATGIVGTVWKPGGYSRIYFATADSIGAPKELPVFSSTSFAGFPSIAADPNQTGFLVSWVEWSGASPFTMSDVIVAHVGLDGTADKITKVWNGPAGPTMIRTDGASTWLTTGIALFHFGTNEPLIAISRPAGDMVIVDQRPRITSAGTDLVGTSCAECGSHYCQYRDWACCPCKTARYRSSLELLSLYESDLSATLATATVTGEGSATPSPPPNFALRAQPAIASDGKTIAIVWAETARALMALLTLPVSDATLSDAIAHPLVLAEQSALSGGPRVACDGTRYVVVWQNHDDIEGAVVMPPAAITPFTITASDAHENDPLVIANGTGSFVVVYNKASSIALRSLTFSMRRRATR